MNPLAQALEAALFAAARSVSLEELARATGVGAAAVEAALQELEEALAGHGIQLERVAGGWRLVTRPALAGPVRAVLDADPPSLSRSALETLAIVAFRQPVTRAQVEELRGVHSEHALRTLLDAGLIEEVGRKEAPGRPILYGTTRRFLEHFGLERPEDLRAALEGDGAAGRRQLELPAARAGTRGDGGPLPAANGEAAG
ncbi:MAG: SMC-Scp complex subunit ScpB [Bacillota bacterium]|nr:SMC-Scp complex subunit ScpB [Bacillota bacterium]